MQRQLAMTDRVVDGCTDCDEDLEHCHGTVVVHLDGSTECLEEPECSLRAEAHHFVLVCTEQRCFTLM
jgi:hypothetical protein